MFCNEVLEISHVVLLSQFSSVVGLCLSESAVIYSCSYTVMLMYNVFDCLVCLVLAVMFKTEKQQHCFPSGPALQLQPHKTKSHGMKVCVGRLCLVCDFFGILCPDS